jgi:heme ABC exporter ATP-binding subunit CcmA
MDAVIRLRDAVSLLGRFPALSGVTLDVGAGEICHLRGANGAGKTSLLRTCAGLMTVVSGDAEVLGVDLRRHRRSVRLMVGLLSHESQLYNDLTVAENLAFWTEAVGAGAGGSSAALDRVGLEPRLADVKVGGLSAGQRRRASLAAMIVRRPRLWLLDEPHAGLDSAGRDLIDSLMHEAVGVGATVVFASHELERADRVATRTVELTGGSVNVDVA